MSHRLLWLVAVAVGAAIPACGGEDAPPDEPIDVVSRYLPDGDPGFLTFADLTTVRDQLGLPANADALPFEILTNDGYDPESREARLLEAARLAMPSFGLAVQEGETVTIREGEDLATGLADLPKPKPDPFTEAFEGRAIASAVTGSAEGGPRGPLTAIRTSQPFDELAEALAKTGYARDGNVLSKPGAPINEVADAGDGVVVLSGREASAADAVADPGGGPQSALALLEPADEPIVEAFAGLSRGCLTGYGGWQDARGSSGAFRITLDGPVGLDRVELDRFRKYTRTDLGQPSAAGSAVEVPFSGGGKQAASPVADFVHGGLGIGLYTCD